MICNQCGKEYFGDCCPDCKKTAENFEVHTQKDSSDIQTSNLEEEKQDSLETRSGVHSDTIRNSFLGNSNSISASVSSWRQVGGIASNMSQSSSFKGYCSRCGKPLNGRFCASCGYDSLNAVQTTQAAQPDQMNFTQRYQAFINDDRFAKEYRHKLSPWVIALIIGAILFSIAMVVISAISYSVNSERYFNEFWQDYADSDNDAGDRYDDGIFTSGPDDYDDSDEMIEDTGESLLPNGVSRAEFYQLKTGMTYAEISSIIGGDSPDVQKDSQNPNRLVAYWPGEYNTDALVIIVFEDSVAVEISEEDLFE